MGNVLKLGEFTEDEYYLSGINDIIHCHQIGTDKTFRIVECLLNDIFNLSALFPKYKLYLDMDSNSAYMTLISTDIEYMFYLIRSIFDIIANLIKNYSISMNKTETPKSFHKLIKSDEIKLRHKYKFSDEMVNEIISSKDFFTYIQLIRDGISHKGLQINPIIFKFPKEGFGIFAHTPPFVFVPGIQQSNIKQNNIASLLYVYARIVTDLFGHLNNILVLISNNYEKIIKDEWRLIFKGPSILYFNKLKDYLLNPWDFS